MLTRKHIHEEAFPVSAERLFALLHTPSAIRGWWGVNRAIVIPERGGIWVAAWGSEEDTPDYITTATIKEFDPPRRLVLGDYRYFAKTGPLPFQADFLTEFTVEARHQGALLRVIQDGFPADSVADAFYAGCQKGWFDTFQGIRRFLA